MWVCLHEGGVHPTLAGVAVGLLAPLERLEDAIHPWTSYLVVPISALANTGIELTGEGLSDASRSAITWGVIAGLVLGKPLGVVVASRLAVRTGVGEQLAGSTSRQMLGIGAAAGIGFTVALFITELAFTDEAQRQEAKIGILVASVTAALLSLALLGLSASRRRR
jgi:Na+/H+ antiporter NhaA